MDIATTHHANSTTSPLRRDGAFVGMLLAMVPLCALSLVMGEGDLAAGLAPLLMALAAFAMVKLPLRNTLFTLLFLVFSVDNPMERPSVGMWQSPLYPLGRVLFVNLSKTLGVGALAFSPLDFLMLLMLALTFLRKSEVAARPVKPLVQLMALSFFWILLLEAYGIGIRHGDYKASLWQIRAPLFTPLVAFLMVRVFNRPSDCIAMGKTIIAASCIKALIGFYFYWFVCRPMNFRPQYVTSHADTMLYATTVGICTCWYFETKSKRALWLNILVLPIIMIGIITNDRRLVWVSLAGGFATIFYLMAPSVRRRFVKMGILASPFLALYVAVGLRSNAAIFKPVQRIFSVASQDDRSSATRDIENYNLIKTLKKAPIIGMGFGHEYDELVVADSISAVFALYKFIAHNSVLWIWAIAGWWGFSAIWLYLACIAFLAIRTYRFTDVPVKRTAAVAALFAVIAYMMQAWGDMGMENWTGVMLVGMSAAVVNTLAKDTGAWA